MKTTLLTLAIALALAGCDRTLDQKPPQAGAGASAPQSNTPSTPANVGTPSAAEKKEGANPVQGQVDPKQPEQRKDFQQKSGG
jgi:hypothetical protein